MPPIKHNGKTIGYYAEINSSEHTRYMAESVLVPWEVRIMEDGQQAGVHTLFTIPGQREQLAATQFIEEVGLTNQMVAFVNQKYLGNFSIKLYRK